MSEMRDVAVLSGVSEQGFPWRVEAGGPDSDFMTMMRLSVDGREVSGGGMGGPKLRPGTVMQEFRGRDDGLPCVVVSRLAPSIDRVVVTTDLGKEIELPLSPVVAEFGVRFAAAVLPDGHGPGLIRAESEGEVVQTIRQWMPPPRR